MTGRAAGLDVCIEFGFVFDRGSAAEPVEGDGAQVIGPADVDGSVLRVNGE